MCFYNYFFAQIPSPEEIQLCETLRQLFWQTFYWVFALGLYHMKDSKRGKRIERAINLKEKNSI
jgi:hypothetical protein